MLLRGLKINLRTLKTTDTQSIYENINDRAIARYTSSIPYPYKLSDAKKFIAQTHKNKTKKLRLGIEDSKTKKIIGVIGLESINYHGHRGAILGYWLGKKYWGQGIMTEAVNLILQHAFKKMNLKRIQASVMRPNQASMKVLEKCGFQHEGILRQKVFKNKKWLDIFIYGILKEEYKKEKGRGIKEKK